MLTPEQLEGSRWSSAVICPRRTLYEYHHEPSDKVPKELEGLFWRGKVLGNAYQEKFAEENPGWVVEMDAPWGNFKGEPIGVAHADLGNVTLQKNIEVKTAVRGVQRHAYLQAAGQAVFLGFERAELHVIDVASGNTDIIPVNVEAFRDEVEVIVQDITDSLEHNTVLPRVCDTPGDWRARGCMHRTRCFAGWLGDVDISEEVEQTVHLDEEETLQQLKALDMEIKDAKKHLENLHGSRDFLREKIRPTLATGVWIPFGDGEWQVRVTEVTGTRSLSVGRMEAAGWDVPPAFSGLVTEGKGYERWSFKRRN